MSQGTHYQKSEKWICFELPILLLKIYLKEGNTQMISDVCINMLNSVLFTKAILKNNLMYNNEDELNK